MKIKERSCNGCIQSLFSSSFLLAVLPAQLFNPKKIKPQAAVTVQQAYVKTQNGIWPGLPHNPDGYTQKIFWWSEVFSLKDELQPALVVFGERLDEEAPALKASRATNASAGEIGDAMLVGVDFPTPGCWKITGQYKKSELSFVV